MRRHITITVATILLAAVACSVSWSEGTQEVRIGSYLLLRVRCPAGGYSIDERVAALQQRANDLLQTKRTPMAFSVRMSGADANIYSDEKFFMTVTSADGNANGTSARKLANIWAERLRYMFPNSIPEKPGVGRPGQVGAPGNAK